MMSRAEAKLFKERWKLVNETINEEIRDTPVEMKLQQLAILFAFGQTMGWTENQTEVELVRNRWLLLKEKMEKIAYGSKALV